MKNWKARLEPTIKKTQIFLIFYQIPSKPDSMYMYIFQNPFLLPLFVLIYLIVLYFILHLWQFKWIIWFPGRVSSSCSTSDTRRVNLVTNPVTSHESRKDREVFTTSGTHPWSFVTQIFHSGQPSHGGDHNTFEVMTST